MAGGKLLTFRECDIPDPPAVSYAKSIENLLLVWDDNSLDWDNTSPLKINGIPIPLTYWPTVYKYWKRNSMEGRQENLHMKYTPLLTQLSKERKVENEKLAEVAQRELKSEQLTYRKGADRFVMTKPSMIAAYYRKLKGLDVEEDGDEDY
ncbi:hypothetical protein DFH07DRAFT_737501 [Mycena maculata]|uniref:Uncharacterized protein n=1 Tax=Mycena maculata TaxID=230809 RepID=A0AAD7NKT4_9AGAR|nr:hypothetical protein DFH07DRAFT_737410 [Mycena maculata]KAJ7765928.1 hypothetical protein DFH07DRAFT_737501 [Mycena maculata]